MLWKLFKRNKKNAGLGSRVDKRKAVNFRCRESGSYPVDYEITKPMLGILKKMKEEIDQMIQNGMVDEFVTEEIFDEYVEAHIQLLRNDIERQSLKHSMSIYAIESELQTVLGINKAYKRLGKEVLDEQQQSNQQIEKEDERYE